MKLKVITLLVVIVTSASAQVKYDSTKRVNYAAIPIVNYDPSLGVNFGLIAQAFYKLDTNDLVSPSSSTGAMGIYTTNGTYFTALFQQFYLMEDNWRIKAIAGMGTINFQYWQDIPIIGGQYIGFSTDAKFALLQVERRIYEKLYGGVNTTITKAKTVFDLPDIIPEDLRTDERYLNNIGYLLNYDIREHQMNPYGGFNVEFKNNFFRESFGGADDFNKYELTYNHYYMLGNEKKILATRIKSTIATGSVPFQGENVVGRDDIRGYSSGKYRANQVYTMQAEYRWNFYNKLGMVAFAGVASAVDKMNQIPTTELLPGIGLGFRYLMISKERINVGIDIAKGKDDWGMYFRIGEAFGR